MQFYTTAEEGRDQIAFIQFISQDKVPVLPKKVLPCNVFLVSKKKYFPALSGGLCTQCNGRRPPAGGGAHGAGDSARQRAPESSRKEQQPGADALQHPSALSGHHPCQQEEQTTYRYLRPSFLLPLLTFESTDRPSVVKALVVCRWKKSLIFRLIRSKTNRQS